ncbi:MAG: sigma 54-interacting transcriptional regulator [Planctomyces sp.]
MQSGAADRTSTDQVGPDPDAFLLTWDGGTWRDAVRLKRQLVTTIGRSTTNRLVLQDEGASRNHCEVFFADSEWKLRDLKSRNGTQLNGRKVNADEPLAPGDVISIGACRLAFCHSLDELAVARPRNLVDNDNATLPGRDTPPPSILHSAARPQFAGSASQLTAYASVLSRLYQLGLDLGSAGTRSELADVVLASLERETVAMIVAVLVFMPDQSAAADSSTSDLKLLGYRSRSDLPYRRVSDNLSRKVLESGEAILARDVADDRQLSMFDSLGEMKALSVICAPIRAAEHTLGLIHLYSGNPENPLDRGDLDFCLAVAGQMAVALRNLQQRETLAKGLARARSANDLLRSQLPGAGGLVGQTPSMVNLREQIALIAETDAIVLIRGESGCGKELIARSIHDRSSRRDGPFVCLNCAALNESLLESELFGHEKGAFTGASDRRIGRFEQADGGTLFLDEVGEMSGSIQAKFLRILEGHPFERIGGRRPVQVNVRVLAATNRDLEAAVADGSFRSDLYFRLQVAEITAPPLRDRKADIPLLAAEFLQRCVLKTGRRITGFTDEALLRLQEHAWKGNVRELQNTIERTVILCRNEIIREVDLQLSPLARRHPPDTPPASDSPAAFSSGDAWQQLSLADVERAHILKTLEHTGGNKSRAAQILGIERSTLDRRLKRLNE